MKEHASNPLRQELARSQQAGPHPDAGMLSAFAEGALLVREREDVLAHLAVCPRCREVVRVAVAAAPEPAAEVQPQTLPRPTDPLVRSWLRWGAIVLALLVVCSAVLLHQPKRPEFQSPSSESASVATKQTPPAPASSDQQPQLSPRQEPRARQDKSEPRSVPPTPAAPRRAEISAATPGSAATESQTAPARLAENARARAEAQQQARELSLQRGTQASRRDEVANTIPGSSAPVINQMRADRPEAARSLSAKAAKVPTQPAEAQGAAAAGSAPSFADAAPAPLSRDALTANPTRPHWRINDRGRLERSFGGAPWQAVLTSEKSKFSVVSAAGTEVWAGGESLRLYHSTDNGATWRAIQLPNKNGEQPAIAHIRFQSPQAVTVESQDGTSWATTDGGRTWK